jgi:hypothetical protein
MGVRSGLTASVLYQEGQMGIYTSIAYYYKSRSIEEQGVHTRIIFRRYGLYHND